MNISKTIAIATAVLAIGIAPVAITAQSTNSERPAVREDRPDRPERGDRGGRQNRPHQKPHGLVAFWEKEGVAEEIGLDSTQIDQLEASLDTAKSAVDGEKEILKESMDAVRTLMEEDNPDLDAVLAAIDEVSASKTTIAKATTGHRVAVKNILTAEQEEAMKEIIKEKVRDRMNDRRRGGPRGDEFGGDFPPPTFGGPDDLPGIDEPRLRERRGDRKG